ncbi:MAG: GGDEF domain-containing protein [Lachnospiraceae bacterium]|nr:GGDEF domain-containing protein [Lachnospiraceae bacterium]
MGILHDYLSQIAPEADNDQPSYYQTALTACEWILVVYFILFFLIASLHFRHPELLPAVMAAATLFCRYHVAAFPLRRNLFFYSAINLIWCAWFVMTYGWNSGGQHFLIPILILIFFNIYDPPILKILYFILLIIFRLGLFVFSLSYASSIQLDIFTSILFQFFNSLTFFLLLACLCIIFSSSIQDTERKLRIDNYELHLAAGTDPLTHLPNRRALLDTIGTFREKSPSDIFCVAIADIDHFKHINDTYGHNCGDYTLRQLGECFLKDARANHYHVCRWGGEEFCFFLPGTNIDNAGCLMHELCQTVRKMPLSFEDVNYSITITIGVEENDFSSSLDRILAEADAKLYSGKRAGRDRVVF